MCAVLLGVSILEDGVNLLWMSLEDRCMVISMVLRTNFRELRCVLLLALRCDGLARTDGHSASIQLGEPIVAEVWGELEPDEEGASRCAH